MHSLIWAAVFGHRETVELLIEKGADINAKNEGEDKCTPLIWASRNGHREVVELLIAKGADVD